MLRYLLTTTGLNGTHMSSTRVLNVDISGKPIGLIPWHRAATMIWDGRATPVEIVDGQFWCSPSVSIPKSRIIQTHDYVKLRPLRDKQIVKRVLFARDNYLCQYCSKPLTKSTATVDHVKPKSKFIAEGRPPSDANTYENCVSACAKCNNKKGDRLPYECGMMPVNTPRVPTYVQVLWAGRIYCPIQAEYVSMYFKVDKETLLARSI